MFIIFRSIFIATSILSRIAVSVIIIDDDPRVVIVVIDDVYLAIVVAVDNVDDGFIIVIVIVIAHHTNNNYHSPIHHPSSYKSTTNPSPPISISNSIHCLLTIFTPLISTFIYPTFYYTTYLSSAITKMLIILIGDGVVVVNGIGLDCYSCY